MQIIDQTKDTSVHDHQLYKGHMCVFKLLEVLSIKDLYKSGHHNLNLNVIKSVIRVLVFMFEVFAVSQKDVWQRKEVNHHGKNN